MVSFELSNYDDQKCEEKNLKSTILLFEACGENINLMLSSKIRKLDQLLVCIIPHFSQRSSANFLEFLMKKKKNLMNI